MKLASVRVQWRGISKQRSVNADRKPTFVIVGRVGRISWHPLVAVNIRCPPHLVGPQATNCPLVNTAGRRAPRGLPLKLSCGLPIPVASWKPALPVLAAFSVPIALCQRLRPTSFTAKPPLKSCTSSSTALPAAIDEMRCNWRESSIAVARTSNVSRLSACRPESMSMSSTLGSLAEARRPLPPPPWLVRRSLPPPRRALKSERPRPPSHPASPQP
mmetsp:Transcript_29822/g.77197  ORF Transcript_29822/g.77197 Transcript_29822/m.77197 type:complete len:216 (+) Transcript_29822:246-893(+)